jgi:RNA polymerase sigma-70 factor (ECF subfamily)
MIIDVAAWYEKYGPMVIRRCRKILGNSEDALDAVHDVFVNLLRAKPSLHGRYPSSLLYTMATNICLNRIRKNKREITHPAGWRDSAGGNWQDPDRSGGDEALFSCVDEGFEQVDAELLMEVILKNESEMNRAICFMYHADGMTLKEIGEAVGLSITGVKKRLDAFKIRAKTRMGDV